MYLQACSQWRPEWSAYRLAEELGINRKTAMRYRADPRWFFELEKPDGEPIAVWRRRPLNARGLDDE